MPGHHDHDHQDGRPRSIDDVARELCLCNRCTGELPPFLCMRERIAAALRAERQAD